MSNYNELKIECIICFHNISKTSDLKFYQLAVVIITKNVLKLVEKKS